MNPVDQSWRRTCAFVPPVLVALARVLPVLLGSKVVIGIPPSPHSDISPGIKWIRWTCRIESTTSNREGRRQPPCVFLDDVELFANAFSYL